LAFHAWRRLASHQKDNVVEMKTENHKPMLISCYICGKETIKDF